MISIVRLTKTTPTTESEISALMTELRLDPSTSSVTEARIEEVLRDPYAFLMTVQDEGKIVGMATLYVLPKTAKRIAHVDDVVVSSAYRGQGLGEKLMRAVIEEARAQEVASIELTSRPVREAAQRLYQKVGFVKRDTDAFRLKF